MVQMKDINYIKNAIKNRNKHINTFKMLTKKYGYHPDFYKKRTTELIKEVEILESILNKIK